MKIERIPPGEIDALSFAIIGEELGGIHLDPREEPIIKRVIHTTADFEFARTLAFSPGAVEKGIESLRAGAAVVTDTNMAKAGINKGNLGKLGGDVFCFMSDPDVASEAKSRGVTRAEICMERAAALRRPVIIAVGNAPTALIRLSELMEEGRISPALVVGVPVGFVNVIPAKELILQSAVPHIVIKGRKGGSNIAAAIVNALMLQALAQGEESSIL